MISEISKLTNRFKYNCVDLQSNEYYCQAVWNVIAEVLKEEREYKRAMDRNKKVPFPCACGVTCSFAEYLQAFISAFDRLYLEYRAVHQDFTSLFRATWVRPVLKDREREGDEPERVLFSLHEPPPTMSSLSTLLDPDRIRITPVGYSSAYGEKLPFESHDTEDNEEAKMRLDVIRKRLAQHFEGRSLWVRLWPFTYAYKVCLCLYCDYRDCVTDYRRAIEKLEKEYDFLYRQYEILFGAVDMLPPEGSKKIIMLSREQQKEEEEASGCMQTSTYPERRYGSTMEL
ncbi:unnamed protein product [Hydatigera taeniaeformis]|uniref:US12 prolyl 3-hydroxylase n=1 Tax=Hydatigena taeniaeformis TaxID=6205 RepID=A0A0R3X1I4_HYDTA|nr:unnamed protein product [Hydatigera taeniaeformis]